jgi:hypothetical protein
LVNYQDALEDPGSWLHLSRKAIALTNSQPLLGFGLAEPLLGFGLPELGGYAPIQQFGVLRWLDGHDQALVNVFNLADDAALFSTELPAHLASFRDSKVVDAFSGAALGRLDGLRLDMPLPPMGGFMLVIGRDD